MFTIVSRNFHWSCLSTSSRKQFDGFPSRQYIYKQCMMSMNLSIYLQGGDEIHARKLDRKAQLSTRTSLHHNSQSQPCRAAALPGVAHGGEPPAEDAVSGRGRRLRQLVHDELAHGARVRAAQPVPPLLQERPRRAAQRDHLAVAHRLVLVRHDVRDQLQDI